MQIRYSYRNNCKYTHIALAVIPLFISFCFAQPSQDCSDITPDGLYSCQEQKQFDKCGSKWMLEGNYCAATCERCATKQKLDTVKAASLQVEVWRKEESQNSKKDSECVDVQPLTGDRCEVIKKRGRCGSVEAQGYCQLTCDKCASQQQISTDQGKAQKFSLVEELDKGYTEVNTTTPMPDPTPATSTQPPAALNSQSFLTAAEIKLQELVQQVREEQSPPQKETYAPIVETSINSISPIDNIDQIEIENNLTLRDQNSEQKQVQEQEQELEQLAFERYMLNVQNEEELHINQTSYNHIQVGALADGNLNQTSSNLNQVDVENNVLVVQDSNSNQTSQNFDMVEDNPVLLLDNDLDDPDLSLNDTESFVKETTSIVLESSKQNSALNQNSVPKSVVEDYLAELVLQNNTNNLRNQNPVKIQNELSINNTKDEKVVIENDLPDSIPENWKEDLKILISPDSENQQPELTTGNDSEDEEIFEPIQSSIQTSYAEETQKEQDIKFSSPNFLIIMTDDQGYDDIGYHHAAGILKTPNMDKFARQSVEFSNFYTDSLCAPTRATVMTGRQHLKTGVWGVHGGMDYIDLQEELITEPLLRQGYKTAHFGKWHNGMTSGYAPWDRGFEEAITPHLYVFTNNRVLHNGVAKQTQGWIEEVLADKIIEYMKERAKDGIPFFINWAPMSIHLGRETIQETLEQWIAPQQYMDMYLGKVSDDIAKVFASITYFDVVFGKVLDKLDELGFADNTVVMFFGDNGPHLLGTDHFEPGAIRDIRVASGMYEEKGFIDENGVRNFFFARMNSTFAPSTIIDSNVYIADIFPTVMQFAGATPWGSRKLDGFSFAPLLLEQKWEHKDRSIFFHEVLKNTLLENVLPVLHSGRNTDKKQRLLDFDLGGTGKQGLMTWSGLRLGNYKYIKNHTYDINLGEHVEFWEHRVQYSQPEISDLIYDRMYEGMRNWWAEILEEPASFQKPAFLIGFKGQSVSQVQAVGAHQRTKGIQIHTHHVSGFHKIGDFIAIKLIVQTEATYQIKLNYGWTKNQGAVFKVSIGSWGQIVGGGAVECTARLQGDGQTTLPQIYLNQTTEEQGFVEMKLALINRKNLNDTQPIFYWLNLIEFLML